MKTLLEKCITFPQSITFAAWYTFPTGNPHGEKMKIKTSTVTQKGQIVIPSKLRRKLGIRKGTQIAFIEEDERLLLQPLTAEYVKSLRGALKGGRSPLKTLFEERKRDRKL